jgi:hypothetical protein
VRRDAQDTRKRCAAIGSRVDLAAVTFPDPMADDQVSEARVVFTYPSSGPRCVGKTFVRVSAIGNFK